MQSMEEFQQEREELNQKALKFIGKVNQRFFSLDNQTYRDGALSAKTKELLGLVASMVLRCDDCINYHLANCSDQGYTDEQIDEAFSVALIVGGSIVIPHLRRAIARWGELQQKD
ncbi:MAG: carboxymuconolactone decarboxylase family protein [Spirochaetes bacterium]|nr:carboxymuconolactone decarboxylase family protein [Spirochaetota bacterium]